LCVCLHKESITNDEAIYDILDAAGFIGKNWVFSGLKLGSKSAYDNSKNVENWTADGFNGQFVLRYAEAEVDQQNFWTAICFADHSKNPDPDRILLVFLSDLTVEKDLNFAELYIYNERHLHICI
jgi:hypothetical protein